MNSIDTIAALMAAYGFPVPRLRRNTLEPLRKRVKPGRVEALTAQLAKLKPGTNRYNKIKVRLEKAAKE